MKKGRYPKSDASRERILDAATELFASLGYAGAGVDRLAERSGIAKTAIYYHFGNKEGLLAAVLERAASQWIDAIQLAARQGTDPLERLDRALAGMRTMLEDRPWILKLFQILALEVAAQKPEIRTTLQGIVRKARDAITTGIRDGLGVEVPDAEGVAAMMMATLDGIALGLQIDAFDIPIDRVFADLRRVTSFMVVTRLDPQLGAVFDNPINALGLTASGGSGPATEERHARSRDTDR